MNNTTPAGNPAQTEFLISCSHAPSAAARRVFNVVLCSGHFRASPTYRIERHWMSGHELLYCVSGAGYVRSERKQFRIEPSDVVWLSGDDACWADNRAPWEVLWMRVEGHQIEQAWTALSLENKPVFEGLPKEKTQNIFHFVNALLMDPPSTADAALNCCVAELLGSLLESRETTGQLSGPNNQSFCPELRGALTQMAISPQRSWQACELAKLCGMSERNFFRRFKQATGISPISWLRRERMNRARARLVERGNNIKQIAAEVGYNDAYFFSRDFKRYTGFSPSTYRREHPVSANASATSVMSHK